MAELFGIGKSTVCTIVIEVCNEIVRTLWDSSVGHHFPKTESDYHISISDMEELWQFSYAFAALDGSHLPIACPQVVNGPTRSIITLRNFTQLS